MHLGSPPDAISRALAKTDTTQLPSLDVLRKHADGDLNGCLGVDTRTFEEIEFLLAVEDAEAFVDAASDVFFRATVVALAFACIATLVLPLRLLTQHPYLQGQALP